MVIVATFGQSPLGCCISVMGSKGALQSAMPFFFFLVSCLTMLLSFLCCGVFMGLLQSNTVERNLSGYEKGGLCGEEHTC